MPEPDTLSLEVTTREGGLIGMGLECLSNHLNAGHPLIPVIEDLHNRIATAVMVGPRGADDA